MNIFVFGSNLAGRHGAGSALEAKRYYGAQQGVGIGRTGDAYGIPTKDEKLRVLPLPVIQEHIENFLTYARTHPEHNFVLVAVGCGLAGYEPEQIAPMFKYVPTNCILPSVFRAVLE